MMSDIEAPTKTCKQCGEKSNSLVFVCPKCSEVLPDIDFPVSELANYEAFPLSGESAEARQVLSDFELSSSPDKFEIVPHSTVPEIALLKVTLFLLVLAIVIWWVHGWQSQLPG